jgi:hypothetical protein
MSANVPQWTEGTTYSIGAVVERAGSSPYICIQANNGSFVSAPPNTQYWIASPAPGVLQAGIFPMLGIAWTATGQGGHTWYVGTYPVPGLISGVPLSVTTQIFGYTSDLTLGSALDTLSGAWIVGCEAKAGQIKVYLYEYPNQTSNPLLPANPYVFISWAVTIPTL